MTPPRSAQHCTTNPQRHVNGCGHAALLAQSLDNRLAVTKMPAPRQLLPSELAVPPETSRAQKRIGFRTSLGFTSSWFRV